MFPLDFNKPDVANTIASCTHFQRFRRSVIMSA
ncbi:hypothetical protein BDA96_02G327300 [Sorghum bicolor]|uniref:Uncharacterized protein n=1 Tax=Sorghum bicolor TaxID=4558 RepID=A0A921RR88_SORBI|nr:hypothetical protein BDA96_02G327300 [Sorghum bicolor]